LKNEDVQKNYERINEALSNINLVIKNGKIVKKEDIVDLKSKGKIFCTDERVMKEKSDYFLKKKNEFYEKYYSSFYSSIKVNLTENLLRKVS